MKKLFVFMAFVMVFALMGCHHNVKTQPEVGDVKLYDSPEALFNALGEGINAKQDPQESIMMVNELVKDYPKYENTPVALFMLASFVYDEQLHDLDKARETYQYLIDTYPGTPFADDAAIAITQLGMTPEELVKMFEEAENGELKTEN